MNEDEYLLRDVSDKLDKIKTTQDAVIDLLKVQGLITSEAFVISFSNVLANRSDDIATREKKLSQKLHDAGILKKL